MRDGTYRTKGLCSLQEVDYKNGYQVGTVEGTWLKIKAFNQENNYAKDKYNESTKTEYRIINALLECARETSAPFVGVWTDKETKITHIDPSKYIYHRTNAVQMAEKNNQLSIWDWKNMKEILKADW